MSADYEGPGEPGFPDPSELPKELLLIYKMFEDLQRRLDRIPYEVALIQSGPCPDNFPDMCKALRKKFLEWQDWGRDVKWDIERLEKAVCRIEHHLMGGPKIDPGVICDKDGKPHGVPGGGPGKTKDPPDPPF